MNKHSASFDKIVAEAASPNKMHVSKSLRLTTLPAGLGTPVVSAVLPGVPIRTNSIENELEPLPKVTIPANPMEWNDRRTATNAKDVLRNDVIKVSHRVKITSRGGVP